MRYTFTCPDCRASVAVDRGVRDQLLVEGCVRCGGSVTAAAFDRSETPERSRAGPRGRLGSGLT